MHREKREMPVFVLPAGKKVKLEPSTAAADAKPTCKLMTPQQRKDGLVLRNYTCKNLTSIDLAARLSTVAAAYIDKPVVDETGLDGRYDFTLEWAPRRGGRGNGSAPPPAAAPEASDPDGPNIFTAVQGQLGLKLEPHKRSMEVIVVDKVER